MTLEREMNFVELFVNVKFRFILRSTFFIKYIFRIISFRIASFFDENN